MSHPCDKAFGMFQRVYYGTSAVHAHLRLGQFFVNRYIKHPWPELFYEKNEEKAEAMIKQWLLDNHYFDEPPDVQSVV